MKHHAWITWLVAAALAGLACAKEPRNDKNGEAGASAPKQPVTPQSVPLVAEIELPAGNSLGRGNQVIDAFSPGMSAMAGMSMASMLAEAASAPSLDGADLAKPVRALVLDPKQHDKPVVLVVSVADAAKLRTAAGNDRVAVSGSLALVGSPGAINAARSYALATAPQSVPEWPRAQVFVQTLLTSYRTELEAFKSNPAGALAPGMDESMSRFLSVYMSALVGLSRQIDTVEISLASQGDDGLGGLEMRIRPLPGSLLAQFIGAQKPASFGLLGKLPADSDAFMVMAGELVAGPARDALLAFGTETMTVLPTFLGKNEDFKSMLVPWMSLFTGDVACTLRFGGTGMHLALLTAVTDAAKAAEYSTRWSQAVAAAGPMETMGIKQTVTFHPNVFVHNGVTVSEQRTVMEMSSLPPEQQAQVQAAGLTETKYYIGGFDSYLAMASGEETMRRLIDASRGKGPAFTPRPAGERALALARARKDSLIMYTDLAGVADDSPLAALKSTSSASIIISTGFSASTMNLFVAMAR